MTCCDLESDDRIDLTSYPKGVKRLAEAEAFTERQMWSRVERGGEVLRARRTMGGSTISPTAMERRA